MYHISLAYIPLVVPTYAVLPVASKSIDHMPEIGC